jgi:signal transduction histidine kinase
MAFSERVLGLLKSVNEIATDVQSLSRSLHSSVLETPGLSRSLRSLCSEYSNQQRIQIDLDQSGIPKSIPRGTALCPFRIVQEALRNVSKHTRASRVEVKLAGSNAEISLTLSDNGVGFDPSKHHASNGIGIQSMKERILMVNGAFEI